MQELELLAPARNLSIGIAAIDCGADAIYIAGPAFGARQAAGNSIEDISKLCKYAHLFGVKVFLTLNTLIFDSEIHRARVMAHEAEDAGVDAFIVQDPAVLRFGLNVPIHASTQCAIRTPQRAQFLESLGFSRLVLERQLSLEQIRSIRKATSCELETFVHGALCVCYSGQCYLSEALAGRSANRGECMQACRSLYDLVEDSEDGHIRRLARNKALLSLKDLNLENRLEELAAEGVCSFKIEGRLKDSSYVRNITREYSLALERLNAKRSSFGIVTGGFRPDSLKTFNRGYTSLFIDGKRGNWSSMDAARHIGEPIGEVLETKRHGSNMTVTLRPMSKAVTLNNGDGFSFIGKDGQVRGFRGSTCQGMEIQTRFTEGLVSGTALYRNIDASFEKSLSSSHCKRLIRVRMVLSFKGCNLTAKAESEDGRCVSANFTVPEAVAENQERMSALITGQIQKNSGIYSFQLEELISANPLPLLSSSFINTIRRTLAEALDALPCHQNPLGTGQGNDSSIRENNILTYKDNVANSISKSLLESRGFHYAEPAYELNHRSGAELMRSKYCIRWQMDMCIKGKSGAKPLYLVNNGRRLLLSFDCKSCEMIVSATDNIGSQTP